MNPFDLSASDLMVWGLVAHLIADWPLQNDWMANNKAKVGHPAGVVHAGIHFVALSVVFGWLPGLVLGVLHYLIDLRKAVAWWSTFVGQTQPSGKGYDIGLEVRFWTDQVFHVACIAAASVLVGALL